jgi:hypothetical protein
MPLSWTEIRDRSIQFQERWKDETSEQAELCALRINFLVSLDITRKTINRLGGQ